MPKPPMTRFGYRQRRHPCAADAEIRDGRTFENHAGMLYRVVWAYHDSNQCAGIRRVDRPNGRITSIRFEALTLRVRKWIS
jgi:hypothetical protein